MMCFLIWFFVAVIVFTLFKRFSGYDDKPYEVPPMWVVAGAVAIFWPATGPAILVYKGVNKLVDKFTKV